MNNHYSYWGSLCSDVVHHKQVVCWDVVGCGKFMMKALVEVNLDYLKKIVFFYSVGYFLIFLIRLEQNKIYFIFTFFIFFIKTKRKDSKKSN